MAADAIDPALCLLGADSQGGRLSSCRRFCGVFPVSFESDNAEGEAAAAPSSRLDTVVLPTCREGAVSSMLPEICCEHAADGAAPPSTPPTLPASPPSSAPALVSSAAACALSPPVFGGSLCCPCFRLFTSAIIFANVSFTVTSNFSLPLVSRPMLPPLNASTERPRFCMHWLCFFVPGFAASDLTG